MDENEYAYPELDFSQLLVPNEKFAVRCETEDEAKQFIAAVRKEFPDKKSHISPSCTYWGDDNDGQDGGRVYFPDLNNVEGDRLLYGDAKYANANGFTLVNFKELIPQTQIDESDMPLDMLFSTAKV